MDDTPGLTKKFSRLNTAVFPDFYSYNTSLERGLWVLLVAKDKLKIRKLTAEEVAIIIRDVKEISIDARSITNAFNRAGNKVHIHEKKFFEIMNPGRELLYSQISKGAVEILYFEAGKRYSSKRCMSQEFLEGLKGDLKIVDPYPGGRTLDILSKVKNKINLKR